MDDRDREATLEDLTERMCEYDAVADAFLAKSFTDRLLVLDLETEGPVPDEIRAVLADHDLRGANSTTGRATSSSIS